jgi:hypothetical protein
MPNAADLLRGASYVGHVLGRVARPNHEPRDVCLCLHGLGPPGAVKRPSRLHGKSVLYGAFVWARMALNSPLRRFPAREGGRSVFVLVD